MPRSLSSNCSVGWRMPGAGRVVTDRRLTPIDLPASVWQCDLTIVDAERRYDASICWTDSGSATTVAGAGAVAVHRLDGQQHRSNTGTPSLSAKSPF